MELFEYMKQRRSIRKYTQDPIEDIKIEKVIQAGLLSASGRSIRPWEFIVVRNKETLQKLSECRVGAAKILAEADCAIVVIADEKKSDVWVEDCSVAMANMHLMADGLGIGSCWVQGRLREAPDGRTTEEYVRNILVFPEKYKLEAILSMGVSEKHPSPYNVEDLRYEKIHREKF